MKLLSSLSTSLSTSLDVVTRGATSVTNTVVTMQLATEVMRDAAIIASIESRRDMLTDSNITAPEFNTKLVELGLADAPVVETAKRQLEL